MSVEEITPETITAVSHEEIDEGRTVALEVGDEVVVTRIRQIQTGDLECPVDGCVRRFETRKGRSTHLGKLHPEYDRRRECPECAERYEPSHADQIYCSRDCYHASGQTTMDCEQCGEAFVVKQSHAESKRFCSQGCYDEYTAERGSSKEERSCETCGDTFEVYPSQEQRFCSRECAGIARRGAAVEKECPTCGDMFETYPSNDCTYCSRDCFYEGRREREHRRCVFCGREMECRPDDEQEYCSQACFFEDHEDRPQSLYLRFQEITQADYTRSSTIDRLRSHLGADATRFEGVVAWALFETDSFEAAAEQVDDVVDEVVESSETWATAVHVARQVCGLDTRAQLGEILSAADEARTWYELTQDLRLSRQRAQKLLRILGIADEVERGVTDQEIFEQARAVLSADDDADDGGTVDDPLEMYRTEVST